MRKLWLILAVLVFPATVFAADAGTVTATAEWVPGQRTKIVKISWIADASGEVWGEVPVPINGKVFQVRTIPSATAAPTDNYDPYIKDYDSSYSYLTTMLENRDTANTEVVVPAYVPLYGTLGFSASAAGNAGAGDCWLWIQVPE